MYVMIVPCIPDPSLRAEGITGDEDMRAYARCLERCKVFGLDVVLLPCPETLYLGKNRAPGSFLDRLDTDEFSSLLDELESVVRKIIFERGEPLCIVGVDSSPACGVKTTWFASDEKSIIVVHSSPDFLKSRRLMCMILHGTGYTLPPLSFLRRNAGTTK